MTTFYCCYNVNNQLMEINANCIIFHENHGAEAPYQRLSLSSTAFCHILLSLLNYMFQLSETLFLATLCVVVQVYCELCMHCYPIYASIKKIKTGCIVFTSQ